MKDFEKFLTDLPKPAVEVSAFRESLRRELLSAAPAGPNRSWRLAATGLAAVATIFLAALALFVARPEIPIGLHATLTGSKVLSSDSLDDTRVDRLLGRAGMPLEADRAFVDSWVAQQARPVAIRSMKNERLVSVRQFELTDGKRMLVFTELGGEEDKPKVVRAGSSAQFF
jgi:hypothetical protein